MSCLANLQTRSCSGQQVNRKISHLLFVITLIFCSAITAIAEAPPPYIEDPGPLVSAKPRVLIGYTFPARQSELSFSMNTASDMRKVQQLSKIDGIWTELVIPFRSAYPVGFTTGFGYLVPGNYRSREIYHLRNGGAVERSWRTNATFFNLRLSIDYSFTDSWTGLLGFHYDSFMANFLDPEIPGPGGLGFDTSQEARINVTGGSPFGGVMYERNFWQGANVRVYAIGYPGLPSVLTYEETIQGGKAIRFSTEASPGSKETSSGYFFEAFTQLTTPVWRGIVGGAFAKYSEYSAKLVGADVTLHDPSSDPDPSLSSEVDYLRSTWTFGGVISAQF